MLKQYDLTKNGWGQFTPEYWGQFAPELRGQFQAVNWGLFGRNFQLQVQRERMVLMAVMEQPEQPALQGQME